MRLSIPLLPYTGTNPSYLSLDTIVSPNPTRSSSFEAFDVALNFALASTPHLWPGVYLALIEPTRCVL
ncbi:hypothetical protein C8R41DRAFT_840522 [Lentinula lateritia]|uniref:Uncharacterized protein n=1 Tax=Lentinula lateritia TaxID=40482 RepID=A0ABQ8VAR5_9AGAR|nr:hypothetical protein C8R41DRAFT_840522 [Lentinula lateritia]